MLNILALLMTASIIFIVICFIFGMATMSHKYMKKLSVEAIVVVYSVLLFICLDVLVSPYKFMLFNTSHLISSNILSIFFFGVLLDIVVKRLGFIEIECKCNIFVYVLSRTIPQFLISQNLFWYMLENLKYDYFIGIIINAVFWCLVMACGDKYFKRSNRMTLYHALDVGIQLCAGGYLYLVSGNILLPITLVICSTWINESRKNLK